MQRVPATHLFAARHAVAAVHAELPHDGRAGDLGLELFVDAFLDDLAATGGAGVGQRGVEDFGDLGGRRRFTMGVRAVLDAGLAARLFGFGFGSPLEKGAA